jgi:hypothetical protein
VGTANVDVIGPAERPTAERWNYYSEILEISINIPTRIA